MYLFWKILLPSISVSSWSELGKKGQLSKSSGTPSPSLSSPLSHASPIKLLFWSSCPGFETLGQLSQMSPTPSLSESAWFVLGISGQLSVSLMIPSLSMSSSHMSPRPSLSASSCSGFAISGQLSQTSPKPSPSWSSWSLFASYGQLSFSSIIPSLSESSSQLSPIPSPSTSSWPELGKLGQLSWLQWMSVQSNSLSGKPSESVSVPQIIPFPAYPGLQMQSPFSSSEALPSHSIE